MPGCRRRDLFGAFRILPPTFNLSFPMIGMSQATMFRGIFFTSNQAESLSRKRHSVRAALESEGRYTKIIIEGRRYDTGSVTLVPALTDECQYAIST
jgi:hypothetical protein